MKEKNISDEKSRRRDKINILVTIDANYIGPLKVMLKSLALNNPDELFHIWLLHSSVPGKDLAALSEYSAAQGMSWTAIKVGRELFESAPITKQYPREMYYRLLAPFLLPAFLDRILYLDPDMLVLNSVRPLWEMALKDNTFAAASHSIIFEIVHKVNRARLGTTGSENDYFNTGVLLMDLSKARKLISTDDVFSYVRKKAEQLLLPDQDVFNGLYGSHTLPINDVIWNYDARYYSVYLFQSNGKCDMDWIMRHTVFLHFCGKKKPWKKKYSVRFAALYKHYMNLIKSER